MHESTDSANRAYDWSYFLHRIDGGYFKIPNGRNWPNTNYLGLDIVKQISRFLDNSWSISNNSSWNLCMGAWASKIANSVSSFYNHEVSVLILYQKH